MIDEMIGLGVFPLLRMNGEGLFPERVRVRLGESGELNFDQGIEAGDVQVLP
jgi:hypothetical protein